MLSLAPGKGLGYPSIAATANLGRLAAVRCQRFWGAALGFLRPEESEQACLIWRQSQEKLWSVHRVLCDERAVWQVLFPSARRKFNSFHLQTISRPRAYFVTGVNRHERRALATSGKRTPRLHARPAPHGSFRSMALTPQPHALVRPRCIPVRPPQHAAFKRLARLNPHAFAVSQYGSIDGWPAWRCFIRFGARCVKLREQPAPEPAHQTDRSTLRVS